MGRNGGRTVRLVQKPKWDEIHQKLLLSKDFAGGRAMRLVTIAEIERAGNWYSFSKVRFSDGSEWLRGSIDDENRR
jgi:hypothetical protein